MTDTPTTDRAGTLLAADDPEGPSPLALDDGPTYLVDEYGTVWSGEPGAAGSQAVGDLDWEQVSDADFYGNRSARVTARMLATPRPPVRGED